MKLNKMLEVTQTVTQIRTMPDAGEEHPDKANRVVKPPKEPIIKDKPVEENKPKDTVEIPKEIELYLSGEKMDVNFDRVINGTIDKLKSLDNPDEKQMEKLEALKAMNTAERQKFYSLFKDPKIKTFDDFINKIIEVYATQK